MRIGIDANPVDRKERIGIGSYTHNLITSLGNIDHENEYVLFYNSLRRSKEHFFSPELPNFRNYVTKTPNAHTNALISSFTSSQMSRNLKKEKVNVFHSVSYGVVRSKKVKIVSTIHDLTPFVLNLDYHKDSLKAIRKGFDKILSSSERIITVSDNTKKDLASFFSIKEDRIMVTHLGVDDRFTRLNDDILSRKTAARYGLPKKFILYVGNLGAHKNIFQLINAYSILARKGVEHKLVLAGSKGTAANKADELIKALSLEKKVLMTGYINDEDLPAVYNLADVFVFPSLYEGFGLPVLEAMACGVPVAASNVSSIPEVAGDAAMLFDPNDPKDISSKIDKIIRDDALRNKLIIKGLERAKRFTWEDTARKTLEVYRSVC